MPAAPSTSFSSPSGGVRRLQEALQEETAKRRGTEAALREAYETMERQRVGAERQQQVAAAEMELLRRAAAEGRSATAELSGRQQGMDKARADADAASEEVGGLRRELENSKRRAVAYVS